MTMPDTNQEADNSQERNFSLATVLDSLRNSTILNLEMPLKTLFEHIQILQLDPSTEWGIISDSGHWVLVWKDK